MIFKVFLVIMGFTMGFTLISLNNVFGFVTGTLLNIISAYSAPYSLDNMDETII